LPGASSVPPGASSILPGEWSILPGGSSILPGDPMTTGKSILTRRQRVASRATKDIRVRFPLILRSPTDYKFVLGGMGMSGGAKVCQVLVVEDHEVTRRSLSKLLQYAGHLVTTAGSVAEARRCLRETFDAVILDVQLPDGNGLDLIGECTTLNALAVVAVVTGA